MALAGTLATLALEAVAARLDVGLLAFKTRDAVELVLLVCGVLAAAEVLRTARRRTTTRLVALLPVVVTAAAAAGAGHHVATEWATGPGALVAQTTRYPDGSVPAGDPDEVPYYKTLFVEPGDPSVDDVREAWRSLRPDVALEDAVLVTTRVDLLATTPVHWFLATKSIYSHPNGRFEDRVALLEEVAACPTSSCAADLLRGNDLDRVDGLVLRRDGTDLVVPFTVDDFPDRTRSDAVRLPDRVLRGPEFVRRELGPVVVVALRP